MTITTSGRVIASGFPRITSLAESVLALPGLTAWFNARSPSGLTLDSSNRVEEWRSLRRGGGT